MRVIGLSIITSLLVVGTVSAQVREPVGQKFSPSQISVYSPHHPIDWSLVHRTESICAGKVAKTYSHRREIYLFCLRADLGPSGYYVIYKNLDSPIWSADPKFTYKVQQ